MFQIIEWFNYWPSNAFDWSFYILITQCLRCFSLFLTAEVLLWCSCSSEPSSESDSVEASSLEMIVEVCYILTCSSLDSCSKTLLSSVSSSWPPLRRLSSISCPPLVWNYSLIFERLEFIFLKSWTIWRTWYFFWAILVFRSESLESSPSRLVPVALNYKKLFIWVCSWMYSDLSSWRSERILPKLLTMSRTCFFVFSNFTLRWSTAAPDWSGCTLASSNSFLEASSPALIPARVAYLIFFSASFSALTLT